ncbi:xylulokinase [Paenibacillus sp. UNCCL117]|uniref:xylulokinase n=1 Tax=unclassified Paenibacillus TaxID=185978 RepID=UPI000885C5EF|nr:MULTISPECIES: xylulokinase [unclassified Paenibacillus]SDC65729.1 xylulokinase [Paenibacillus sp. cl123]SFW22845.1 xylulokinase [Paenibacillus sp. UNCCL117]
MSYVIGIDLGTGSVKALLVNKQGELRGEASRSYPLMQPQAGYSEQDPEEWVEQTALAVSALLRESGVDAREVEALSFSGQMHGLVLLDAEGQVLRPAILWNDTRTTPQCRRIESALGPRLLDITKNAALEGFTLPKLLWVQEHEPELLARAAAFLLPKDYVRYRITGQLQMELSDAAGTLLLDVTGARWSDEVCDALGLDRKLCPPLVGSLEQTGTVQPEFGSRAGLDSATRVFAGGADNACGAVGAGIVEPGAALCSIGTSGVLLSYEEQERDFGGKLHFFNHAQPSSYYAMGVTLAAGYSLDWLKKTVAPQHSFDSFVSAAAQVPIGAGGLLFTPYLVGERTPHADSAIRGSFIGLDGSHGREHLTRAVLEGITFSLNESVERLRDAGVSVDTIVSIGGGAKSGLWLQMQADIFGAAVVSLENEQGPALGAAMLAAVGSGWFGSLRECAAVFVRRGRVYRPDEQRAAVYRELFQLYRDVYASTRELNHRLHAFR